ncbi:MAG: hypothetical protein AAF748_02605 [Pseudomonadota bacterium]
MRTFVLVAALAVGALSAGAASAQQLLGEYYTLIGPRDFFNSSGTRLTNFCAIIQQDRANYHRFGVADPADGWDPFFQDRAARSRISQTCYTPPGNEYIRDFLLSGQTRYLWVRVYGAGGVITAVEVREGAG